MSGGSCHCPHLQASALRLYSILSSWQIETHPTSPTRQGREVGLGLREGGWPGRRGEDELRGQTWRLSPTGPPFPGRHTGETPPNAIGGRGCMWTAGDRRGNAQRNRPNGIGPME
eukprot:355087-Chlamydomonas_euryale.AAC.2